MAVQHERIYPSTVLITVFYTKLLDGTLYDPASPILDVRKPDLSVVEMTYTGHPATGTYTVLVNFTDVGDWHIRGNSTTPGELTSEVMIVPVVSDGF